MNSSIRTARLVSVVVLIAATLSGCAAAQDTKSAPLDYPDVTQDDYRSGFETFATCMEDAGYPLAEIDDSATVITYSILATAVDNGIEGACYEPFEQIDQAWQVANEDTSVGALAIRACLEENGIEPVGTAAGDWELVLKNELEETCR